MTVILPTKDPQEVKDYGVDFTDLLTTGETISTTTWTVPTGITKVADALTRTVGAIAYVNLSGGTIGQVYTIVCTITTSAGRTYERSFKVPVGTL